MVNLKKKTFCGYFLGSNQYWAGRLYGLFVHFMTRASTGIIPFSDCGEFAASLVSGVVSFMVEGRVGSVKG